MKYLILLILTIFIGCPDAIRDNPYDINNPRSRGGLYGRVLTYALKPVDYAKIILNDSIFSLTDEDGYYRFTDLKPGLYIIKIMKENYETIIDSTVIKAGIIDTIDFKINSIPYFTYTNVFSRFTKWYDGTKLNEVLIYAVVTDYDYILDLKNVYFINEYDTNFGRFISFADPFGYSGLYKGKFLENDINNFEKDTFYFLSEDKKGFKSFSIKILHNVIDTFTEFISPQLGETLYLPYVFIWNKFKTYNYTLTFWKREDGIDNPSKVFEDIKDTFLEVTDFSPGIYEWTVFIVNDERNIGGKVGWFTIK